MGDTPLIRVLPGRCSHDSHLARKSCCFVYPIEVTLDDQRDEVGVDGDDADPRMAVMGEPIVGVDKVVYDDSTGHGALAARPLSSPKTMSAAQRAIHDLATCLMILAAKCVCIYSPT